MNKINSVLENLNRSKKMMDTWPSWKREYLITEYSENIKHLEATSSNESKRTNTKGSHKP